MTNLTGRIMVQYDEGSVGQLSGIFSEYRLLENTYDELFESSGCPRAVVEDLIYSLDSVSPDQFESYQEIANYILRKNGTTFTVYSEQGNMDKIFPFDLIPRVISAKEWQKIERGLIQRVNALNIFLTDIYGEQRILKEKVIPLEHVLASAGYFESLRHIHPLGDTRINVAGIDLIRRCDGEFLVLEDNLRVPSGVSYVLENRLTLKNTLPRVFQQNKIRSVDDYPTKFIEALRSLHPQQENMAVILTPGPYNSAYFEHGFLARKMGCHLAEGNDLCVEQDKVFIKTTRGLKQVDIIYSRVNDEWLDPEVFRKDSLLGVKGLVKAYAARNVILANALGNGVADDKAIYPFVPAMIRYYLNEEPILSQVETYLASDAKQREYILKNLDQLVVKTVDAAGGYGMLFGPSASSVEKKEFEEKIKKNPRAYIAQPIMELSTCPTWTDKEMKPRRVDLRPYIVRGKETWVLPGGLSRVALVEGSYVVNSSQGGGSKDTWVLMDE